MLSWKRRPIANFWVSSSSSLWGRRRPLGSDWRVRVWTKVRSDTVLKKKTEKTKLGHELQTHLLTAMLIPGRTEECKHLCVQGHNFWTLKSDASGTQVQDKWSRHLCRSVHTLTKTQSCHRKSYWQNDLTKINMNKYKHSLADPQRCCMFISFNDPVNQRVYLYLDRDRCTAAR